MGATTDPRDATSLRSNVALALARLGPDQKQAKRVLRRLGVKGERRSTCLCVLAIYLKQAIGRDWGVFVYPDSREVSYCLESGESTSIVLPAHLKRLALAFDAGKLAEFEAR